MWGLDEWKLVKGSRLNWFKVEEIDGQQERLERALVLDPNEKRKKKKKNENAYDITHSATIDMPKFWKA